MSNNVQVADEYKTLDEQYLEIAKQIPNFAGVYEGNDGVLVAKIAEGPALTAQQVPSGDVTVAEVKDAILEVLGQEIFTGVPNDLAASAGSLQALQETAPSVQLRLEATKYTFRQLKTWFLQIAALNLDGIIIYDANEGKNNVYLGVETKAQAAKVKARVAKLNFPSDAVEVQVVGSSDNLVLNGAELEAYKAQQQLEASEMTLEPTATQDTNGYNNPLVGGIEIETATGGTCTYGFSARRLGVYGFVSNNHCTTSGNRGDTIKQASSVIGYEVVNPVARGCGLVWIACIDADAAFFRHVNRPVVPMVAGTGPEPGDKTYTYSSLVQGFFSGPALNQHYIAVTARTGFTRIITTNTCTFLRPSGTDVTVECGAVAKPEPGYPNVDRGDSGSPVITRNGTSSNLVGQVFARNTLAGTIWLNNMSGIRQSIDNLITSW